MALPRLVDQYTLKARLLPALIAGASAFCAFFVLAPWDKMGLPQLAATLASSVLLVALSDIARRRGKKIEAALFKKWGGKPTTMMLRHGDNSLDTKTKARCHGFLASKIGAACPTAREERARPEQCDTFYERCGDWLRENTRDTEKFKILFDENVTYGFRRNLLGLKWPALAIDAMVAIACAISVGWWVPMDFQNTMSMKLTGILAFTSVHALYFLAFVTESGVREAATQYARQLILCCQLFSESPKAG